MQKIKAKLIEKNQLTDNIYQLVWQVVEGDLSFQSGQYVLIEKSFTGKKIKRAYSISSRPNEMPVFELTVRRFDDGLMSSFLTDLLVGSEVEMLAPLGIFTSGLGKNRRKCLIAIGCGIAPLKSILQDWIENDDYSVSLFYGNRFLDGVPYHEQFKMWQTEKTHFQYYPCISCLTEEVEGVFQGRVYDVMNREINDFTGQDYYLCGSREMIDQVKDFLLSKGVKATNIYFEQIFI